MGEVWHTLAQEVVECIVRHFGKELLAIRVIGIQIARNGFYDSLFLLDIMISAIGGSVLAENAVAFFIGYRCLEGECLILQIAVEGKDRFGRQIVSGFISTVIDERDAVVIDQTWEDAIIEFLQVIETYMEAEVA